MTTDDDLPSGGLLAPDTGMGAVTLRVTDLDGQLVAQVKEAETLGGHVSDLESRLAEQAKTLAERESENNRLRQAHADAERTIGELRAEIAALNGGKSPLTDGLRKEKAAAEEAMRAAQTERAKLQRDINVIQQQAESSWATERMENALLRERINDIAAEVAKLAMTIEGPDSPIEAILAAEASPAPAAKAVNGSASNGAMPAAGGTLADRIRALQSNASRSARQPG